MSYKYDADRAKKAFQNAPKPKTLDRRLNDISYHTARLAQVIQDLNDNINQLRQEINQ